MERIILILKCFLFTLPFSTLLSAQNIALGVVNERDPHLYRPSGFRALLMSTVARPLISRSESGHHHLYLVQRISVVEKGSYLFELKKGVVFSDGSPLTIEDVIFSLNLCKRNQLVSKNLGIKDSGNGVIISLKSGDIFTEVERCPIVPGDPALVFGEENGVESHIIGSGPFKISEFSHNRGYYLVRHELYEGTMPYASTVEIRAYRELEVALSALRSGGIAALTLPDYLLTESLNQRIRADETLMVEKCGRNHFITRRSFKLACRGEVMNSSEWRFLN